MDGIKSWLTSKTIWGALVALAGAVLPALGYTIGAEDQAAFLDNIDSLIVGVGAILAIIGRVTASKKIG